MIFTPVFFDISVSYFCYCFKLYKAVEETYNNIEIQVIYVATIDFTGIKNVYEAHQLIREKL